MEDTLIDQRRQKVVALSERGDHPYANDFVVEHAMADLNAVYGDATLYTVGALDALAVPVRVAGRVRAVRTFGGMCFVSLADGSDLFNPHPEGLPTLPAPERDEAADAAEASETPVHDPRVRRRTLQVTLFKKHVLAVDAASWERLALLDLGDIVGVAGTLMRTKAGELSVKVDSLRILTKTLRPLPDKFHGLTDVSARYRMRYVDLMLNDDVRRTFAVRSKVVSAVRRFFEARDYIEVETPMLQALYGGAAARPFNTHHNAMDMKLYLRVAPELNLKRLVVGDLHRVFEINRCFRNEGISTRHNPEFTMLEFYQAFATYEDLMTLSEDLLRTLVREVAGSTDLPYQGQVLDFGSPFRRLSVYEGLVTYAGVPAGQEADLDALRAAAERLGLKKLPDDVGYLQMEVFEAACEHLLIQPTFVTDFPLAVSPLSRKKDANPKLVDRFELYIGGRELSNAFSELNDPDDQRRRFEDQVAQRAAGNDEAHPLDEDYVRALEFGLPPTAGQGIGIDRLVMLLTDSPSIRDVIFFPLLRPEG